MADRFTREQHLVKSSKLVRNIQMGTNTSTILKKYNSKFDIITQLVLTAIILVLQQQIHKPQVDVSIFGYFQGPINLFSKENYSFSAKRV